MNAQQALKILAKDRWVAFATVDEGQPRVRMMTVKYHEGRLWCFTSASSAKIRQLKRESRFEIVANLSEEGSSGSVRAAGRAEMVEDLSVKEDLSKVFEPFKDHWKSHRDPDFMLLRLNIDRLEVETGPDGKPEVFPLDVQGRPV